MRLGLLLLFFLFFSSPFSRAQKVLQVETYGKAKTEKLSIGTPLTYQLKNDDTWYEGTLERLLVDEQIVGLGSRFVHIDSIAAFRYDRNWSRAAGRQLFYFGAAWSGFALVGTLTDGDEDTNYRVSDAVVTGSSWALGYLIPRIFRYKKQKFGPKRRKRLRILDLSDFQGPGYRP